MSPLKVLASALLGLGLFLSLTLFGLALTLNMTVLNADFITSQLERLDLLAVIEETEALEAVAQVPQLATVAHDAITGNEDEIKEQLGLAINDIYDYLLGKEQQLDLATTLGNTILAPELTISIIEDFDLSSLTRELLVEELPLELAPGEFPVEPYMDDVAAELEPWIKEQMTNAVSPVYDYILGKTQALELVISLEPVKEKLGDSLRQAFLESPPPELAGLTTTQLEQEFGRLYAQFSPQIPSAIELVESTPQIQAEVGKAITEAEAALTEARKAISYYQAGFGMLIGAILIVIAGIILINRNVRGSSRILGIVLLVYGLFEVTGVFIARSIIRTQLPTDVPSSIQTWLTKLADSSMSPLLIFSIIAMVAGAVLIAVSLLYRKKEAPA